MTDTRTLTTAAVYWDSSDKLNEGWAWRVAFSDSTHESGEYDGNIDEKNSGLHDAVVDIADQHGVSIERDDVTVDGLYGDYSA